MQMCTVRIKIVYIESISPTNKYYNFSEKFSDLRVAKVIFYQIVAEFTKWHDTLKSRPKYFFSVLAFSSQGLSFYQSLEPNSP